MNPTKIMPRENWTFVLSALPEKIIDDVVASISETWDISHKVLPQSGLGMLELTDTALNENFFLGEFPVSTAHIVISLPDGRTVQGAATSMIDDAGIVWNLAVCDAVLANHLPGWETVSELLIRGKQIINKEEKIRKGMLTTTKVDFSTLDAVEED